MEMACAECGCVVEAGVRVRPCGKADCCCLALPVSLSEITEADRPKSRRVRR
jgi:hypothetical protein